MRIGQRIMNEFQKEKKPKDLIAEGFNRNTVYKYWKVYQLYSSLSQKLWELVYETAR